MYNNSQILGKFMIIREIKQCSLYPLELALLGGCKNDHISLKILSKLALVTQIAVSLLAIPIIFLTGLFEAAYCRCKGSGASLVLEKMCKYMGDHLIRWIPTAIKLIFLPFQDNQFQALGSNYVHYIRDDITETHLVDGDLSVLQELERVWSPAGSWGIPVEFTPNFDQNLKLREIKLRECHLPDPLKLTNNTKLLDLELVKVSMNGTLDLSNNPNLRSLEIKKSPGVVIGDLSNNQKLRSVIIHDCDFEQIPNIYQTLPRDCQLTFTGNPITRRQLLIFAIQVLMVRKANPELGPSILVDLADQDWLNGVAPWICNGPIQDAEANHGMNVHTGARDLKTAEALTSLKDLQGVLSDASIDEAITQFTQFLNLTNLISAGDKLRALHALDGPGDNDFGSLLSDPNCGRYLISGKEVVARHWIYSNSFVDVDPNATENERLNIKLGMIRALSTSYEPHDADRPGQDIRVCNEGKAQRFVVNCLQGRLEGIDIDSVSPNAMVAPDPLQLPNYIRSNAAAESFFTIEANQQIDNLQDLITAANSYCNENSLVEPYSFFAEIMRYAKQAEFY
jgi:hypothetical protein